jgi:vancomycin resistance protein VanW
MIVYHYTVGTFCHVFGGFPAFRGLDRKRGSAKPLKGGGMVVFFLFFFLSLSATSAVEAGNIYTHLWGGYSTSVENRSSEQRGNAGRAAMDLDGVIIAPGGLFSFNDRVGARDTQKGYRPAPIINDRGGLSDIPGGGICQLATTIYNAALDAGLEIAERHPHSRSVGYAPLGRDATILTWRKDLKLRNPNPFPLLLRLELGEGRLTASFWSVAKKSFQVLILSDIIPVEPEAVVADSAREFGEIGQRGGQGFSVVTRRRMIRDGEVREEILSRDFYPPPSRIVGSAGP